MKASMTWMQDYVPVKEDLQVLADALTQAGIPVEEVTCMDKGIKKVYTGQITEITQHPDADKLVVCQIDCLSPEGAPEPKQIVTGASNVRVGQVVPVAYHKSKLPDKSISKGKLRGVLSEGMLCSINELGLSKDVFLPEEAEGIYILPESTAIGQDIKDVMLLNDTVYTFELTPNRADCFSMVGLSREIAALTGEEATMPEVSVIEEGANIEGHAKVAIEDSTLCSRFMGRLVTGVTVGPSPLWMQNRLRNAGIRPINNVVDVTNYVMIEFGQPMHAYDYNRLAEYSLTARLAKEGETIKTLDGEERALTTDMLVIADANGPVGVAGVMGGLESEVTETTTNVLLEAAVFYGKSIRRTARALGLRSEASSRFERGVDSEMTPLALDRAAQLLLEICPGAKVAKGVLDQYPSPKVARTVSFTPAQVNAHLGTDIAPSMMVDILQRLSFTVMAGEGDSLVAKVPSWREDVTAMCDIAEEVARMYGYDNIVPSTPVANLTGGMVSPMHALQRNVVEYLSAAGLSECITFSFMHKDSLQKLRLPETDSRYQAVPILNPISEEFPYMRTTLVPSMLETAMKNRAKKNLDLWLFEVGAVYEPESLPLKDFVNHRQMVTGILVGAKYGAAWPNVQAVTDFYDVKGVMEGLLAHVGLQEYQIERCGEPYFHPGVSATVRVGDVVIARFGEIHPEVAKAYDLADHSYLFEVDLQALLDVPKAPIRFQGISKFPAVQRDLAIVAAKTTTHEAIVSTMTTAGGELLRAVYLFDVYEGEHIQEGYRSMAFSLTFQAMDRTLEDKDIEEAIQNILDALTAIDCQLR